MVVTEELIYKIIQLFVIHLIIKIENILNIENYFEPITLLLLKNNFPNFLSYSFRVFKIIVFPDLMLDAVFQETMNF